MYKVIIASIFVFNFLTNSYGQKSTNSIPPAPNASSLGKFGEIPVSNYTGVPNINIPLWKIQLNGFEMPISLNYHASGIKTTEYAPSVGLGWALNAGGVITRSINGLADDCQWGFLNPTNVKNIKFNYDDASSTSTDDYSTIKRYSIGDWDSQPDNFYFNFNGRSGKFVFNQNKEIFVIPNQKIKVTAQYQGLAISQFTIMTEDGTEYIFAQSENTFSYSVVSTGYGNPGTPGNEPCNPYEQSSSWYLSKVNTINNETVDFKYNLGDSGNQEPPYTVKTNFLSDFTTYKATFSAQSCPDKFYLQKATQSSNLYTQTQSKRLTQIYYKGNLIRFNYNNVRADLIGDKTLDQIKISNEAGNIIKDFRLDYEYKDGNNSPIGITTVTPTPNNADNLRLFLLSITEKDKVANSSLPPYKFSYFPNITERKSNTLLGADYWGYYNGGDKDILIDKNSFLTYATTGTLNQIDYPTGGHTSFEYEKNECQPTSLWNLGILNETQNILSLSSYPAGVDMCASQNPCRKEKYFTISNNNASGSDVKIDIFLQCQNPMQCSANFCIINTQNNQQIFCSNSTNSLPYPSPTYVPPGPGQSNTYSLTNWQKIFLANGNYMIRYSNSDNQYSPTVNNQNNITLTWRTTDGTNNAQAGGLRVKKITDYFGQTQVVKVKNYNYKTLDGGGSPTNISTGFILVSPLHEDHNLGEDYEFYCKPEDALGCKVTTHSYQYLVHHNLTPFVLSATNNSFVGYSQVIETEGSQGINNGRKILKYTSSFEFPLTNPPFPYYVSDNFDMYRGLLKEETIFKPKSYGYVPVKKNEYSYTNFAGDIIIANSGIQNPPYITGLKVGITYSFNKMGTDVCSLNSPIWRFQKAFIGLNKGYSLLTSVTTTNYDQELGNELKVTKNNFYENSSNLLLTRSEEVDSKNNLIRYNYTHPHDYLGVSIYNQMVNRNMIDQKVDETVTNVTLNKPISTLKYNYGTYSSGSSTTPLILFSNVQKSKGVASLETESTINQYDIKGNVLQTTDKNGIVNSYIWGYNYSYPVAKIINGSYDYIVTGSGINLTLINSPTTSDANMRLELNKIRQYTSSFVATYTYLPLVGMTSETDLAGHTKYYEYDNYNRLSLIRDQDNNILKKICYNYAGQVENCVTSAPCTNTTANWQNTTTAVRCKTDANGQFTGEQEQEQKDLNSCSPSYNTLRWIVIGTNTSLCPMPSTCNFSTCASQGEAYACIKGMCERGFKVFTSSTYDNYSGMYTCNYHYEYSDGTWSYDYSTTSQTDCYQSFTP